MHYIRAILVILFLSHVNGNFNMCRSFESSEKAIRLFCGDWWPIEHQCLNSSFFSLSTRSFEVLKLQMQNCDRDTVANTLEAYQTVIAFDFSHSKYKSSDETYLTFGKYSLDFLEIKHNGIQSLNGSRNSFAHVPHKMFEAYPELAEIDFSFNKFRSVNLSEFSSASKLKTVHLASNRIRTIGVDDFARFIHLESVDLSENRIQYIWAEIFQYNTILQALYFDGNPLEYFNCRRFFTMSIASVRLPWTQLQAFIFTFCPDMAFDVIVGDERDDAGLFATSKGQYRIHCGKESFESLTYVSIGPQQIRNLTALLQCFTQSLEDISLDGLALGELNSTIFRPFLNLKRISLKNTQLHRFDFSLLINQRHLHTLDISKNNLTLLHNVLLSQFSPNLTHFLAAGNRFENAIETILKQLTPSILVLDVSDSPVGAIDGSTFIRLKNLRRLNLNQCNLTIINATDPFEVLQHLISLDVSNNNLRRTNFKRLSTTLTKLKTLRMANCAIHDVYEVTQYLSKSLETLDLSGNFLNELNITTFEMLTGLRYLYLDNAFVTRFDWNTLQAQRKLVELRLTNNQHLSEIDIGSMSNILRWLNFNGNDLTHIKHLTKEHFPHLEHLQIANNRLECEVLQQLYREWGKVLSHFNPWQQKHRHNCIHPFIGNDRNKLLK